jgi:hypothetical protein
MYSFRYPQVISHGQEGVMGQVNILSISISAENVSAGFLAQGHIVAVVRLGKIALFFTLLRCKLRGSIL